MVDAGDEARLIDCYRALGQSGRGQLLAFAEFLVQRAGGGGEEPAPPSATPVPVEPLPAPLDIPAPEGESVVKAVRRLSQRYFMLSKNQMLGRTSDLMTQHVMLGRAADEVIAELEQLFAEAYETLRRTRETGDSGP